MHWINSEMTSERASVFIYIMCGIYNIDDILAITCRSGVDALLEFFGEVA